jgi:hypothetical protein
MTGAAVVVSAALVLTGCDGGTGGGGGGKDKGGSSHHTASKDKGKDTSDGGSGGGGISAGGGSIDTSALKGAWENGGIGNPDYVRLTLLDGAGVVVTTLEASCIGSYEDAGSALKIQTKCKKGHGFESGMIKSLRNGKLTVSFGGKTDVFEKAHDM